MELNKEQSDLVDHFSNLIMKGLEVHQLRNAAMMMKVKQAEQGSNEETTELCNDVQEDLSIARLDLWDMVCEISDRLEIYNDDEERPEESGC